MLDPSVTRPVLDLQQWGTGKINATPYGHCVSATGEYAIKPADPKDLAQKASHIGVDEYGPPEPPPLYLPGKKMVEQVQRGGRRDLFDLMQNRWVGRRGCEKVGTAPYGRALEHSIRIAGRQPPCRATGSSVSE
jgi:hypothetical protein